LCYNIGEEEVFRAAQGAALGFASFSRDAAASSDIIRRGYL
jgi:hypothetical protein